MAAPAFIQKYVKTGQVRLVYHEYPLDSHPNAVPAAEAARCAGDQGKYWEMHDLLFANQRQWSPLQKPQAQFGAYAATIGLDAQKFTQCLNDGVNRQAVLQARAAGNQLKISGTPSFAVNGTVVNTFGVSTVEEIVTRVEQAIAEAR